MVVLTIFEPLLQINPVSLGSLFGSGPPKPCHIPIPYCPDQFEALGSNKSPVVDPVAVFTCALEKEQ